jgi:hypothetical protein
MVPITSAPNCFVDGMNEMQPVYRIDGDGNVSETGVQMSVSQQTLNGAPWRVEAVSFGTAQKALAAIRAMFPQIGSVRLMASSVVTNSGMPALGTANTNLFIVLGSRVAIAPAYILLTSVTADAIEAQVSKLRAGIWGEILDAR